MAWSNDQGALREQIINPYCRPLRGYADLKPDNEQVRSTVA